MDSKSGQVMWECAQDLSQFLSKAVSDPSSVLFDIIRSCKQHLTIIELGCGFGSPACSLASSVVTSGYSGRVSIMFQDYNQETIDSVTKPNVELNLANLRPDKRERISVDFCACSWDECDLSEYHIILSSECIYREDLFESFSRVLDKTLYFPNSVCYIAAKRYYFGCGGGTIEFSEFLARTPVCTSWTVNVVHVEENGFSNTREILEIHR